MLLFEVVEGLLDVLVASVGEAGVGEHGLEAGEHKLQQGEFFDLGGVLDL